MISLAVFLIIFMQENHFKPLKRSERISAWETMKENLDKIIFFSRTSFILRMLFLIALFIGFYSEGFDRLWLPHLLEMAKITTLPMEQLVLLTGGIQLVVVLLSFILLHFLNKSTIYQELNRIYIALFIGCSSIVIALIGFAASEYIIGLLICYVLIQVSRKVMYPLEDIWLNKIIPDSSTRATFFSVKGQVDAVGQISGGPVIGYIATSFTIRTAILISALVLSPVLFLYRILLKKGRG